jgi:RimJ/RimL family protein N-acetyltransferase
VEPERLLSAERALRLSGSLPRRWSPRETIDWLEPQALEGEKVRLDPLDVDHARDLFGQSNDDEIWAYLPSLRPTCRADVEALIRRAADQREHGERLPFAIVDQATGRAIGSTSYVDLQPVHNRVEIGWTWLGRSWWHTAANTEAKRLLLGHAFDRVRVDRVQLTCDARNARSQAAIERLGARREGVLRQHYRCPDGFQRDTVFYGITSADWPAISLALEERLAAGQGFRDDR